MPSTRGPQRGLEASLSALSGEIGIRSGDGYGNRQSRLADPSGIVIDCESGQVSAVKHTKDCENVVGGTLVLGFAISASALQTNG